tara:strand:- start:748 stop:1194 length:447 start_codon:yes stop_codon:yes gene_type:complete
MPGEPANAPCPEDPVTNEPNPSACESGECEVNSEGNSVCTEPSTGGGKRRRKKGKSGKKRGMNNFFKLMLAAKKKKEPSFVYNGTTYYGHPHPMLGMVYKKSKSPLKNLGKTKKKRRGKSKKMGMKKKGKSRRKTRRKAKKSRRRRRR